MCNDCCENYNNNGEPIDPPSSNGLEKGTITQMLAKTGMSSGDMFFVEYAGEPQKNKLFIFSGRTWQSATSGETIELQARENLIKGNVVEIISSGDFTTARTNSSGDPGTIGVSLTNYSLGDWCTICVGGVWEVLSEPAIYTPGRYLRASSALGIAEETTVVSAEPFAKILEATTITAPAPYGIVWAHLHSQEQY
jgi:hypothetical protein